MAYLFWVLSDILFLAYTLTFYLAYFLTYFLVNALILSGILSGIYSDIFSGIHSGIHSGILSGIYSDILFEILSGIYSDILSGICIWQIFWHSFWHYLSSEILCGRGLAEITLIQRLQLGRGPLRSSASGGGGREWEEERQASWHKIEQPSPDRRGKKDRVEWQLAVAQIVSQLSSAFTNWGSLSLSLSLWHSKNQTNKRKTKTN